MDSIQLIFDLVAHCDGDPRYFKQGLLELVNSDQKFTLNPLQRHLVNATNMCVAPEYCDHLISSFAAAWPACAITCLS